MDDAIYLEPDMQKEWGSILRRLRNQGESMLFAACCNLQDIEFTNQQIKINCKDLSTYNLLVKHAEKLGEYVKVEKLKKIEYKSDVIDKLEELLGDKLVIKRD